MKRIFFVALLILAVSNAMAFDYAQIKSGEFTARSVSGVRPMSDGDHYTTLEKGKICKYAYKDGSLVEVLFDASQHTNVRTVSNYYMSGDETKILLVSDSKPIYRYSFTATHWVWDSVGKELKPLSEGGAEQVASFSPNGDKVAFVRDNNLFLVTLSDMSLRRITNDGEKNHIINGHTDWVYEEEYVFTKAYAFSPDGSKIAFLRFDESQVPQFTMMRKFAQNYPEPYVFKYPKAGEKNSVVEVKLFDIASGDCATIDCGENKEYIPCIGWNAQNKLYIYKVNRLQNHFDLLLATADNSTKVIYSETNARYVERLSDANVTFLPDGDRFVVKSEKNGFMHLYLHSVKRGELGAITSGNWDVVDLLDVVGKKVYYLSKEYSPLGQELFCIDLNGKNKRSMTSERGYYTVAQSGGFKYYIQYFSNSQTPNTVTLHREDGSLVRVLEDNAELKQRIKAGDVPQRKFFTFTTERGDVLNGYALYPKDFDKTTQHPVFITQYSGPGSQSVLNRWGVDWCDVLTDKGYVVVCVDGRGTGGRGETFRKCTYGQLGKLEVEDQISVARWAAEQPWTDASRIGIYGWSYGGFMTLGCMFKGNDVFKMGIAVAPVTSWRYYDSVYTEIYNGMPQDNPAGYDDNSPINHADSLRGKLLIIHGTGDDNVHVQNSYAMIDALIKSGKQFDTAIYPDDNHSMRPQGMHHVRERMIDYVLKNL